MRLVKHLMPCVLCFVALTISGCTDQQEKIATLEEENTTLVAQTNDLRTELAAAREELVAANARAADADNERTQLRTQLEAYIEQLTVAKRQEELTKKALEQAQKDLKNTTDEHAKAFAEARASALKAVQAQQVAQKRVAELEQRIMELQSKLAETGQLPKKMRETKEEPPSKDERSSGA